MSKKPKHNLHNALLTTEDIGRWLGIPKFRGQVDDWVHEDLPQHRREALGLTHTTLPKLWSGDSSQPEERFRDLINFIGEKLEHARRGAAEQVRESIQAQLNGLTVKGFLEWKMRDDQQIKAVQTVDELRQFLQRQPVFEAIPLKGEEDLTTLLAKPGVPLLFYHWRQRHEHLHVVDFAFLMAMRSMQKFGLEPHVLVTVKSDAAGGWLDQVERIIGPGRMTTFAQAEEQRDGYLEYATTYARTKQQLHEVLRFRDDPKTLESATWIPWIPYFVRSKARPGYVHLVRKESEERYEYGHIFRDPKVQRCKLVTGAFAVRGVRLKEFDPPLLMTIKSLEGWVLGNKEKANVPLEVSELLTHLRHIDNAAAFPPSRRSTWTDRARTQALPDESIPLISEFAEFVGRYQSLGMIP